MPTSLKIDHARYVVTVDDRRRIIQDGSIVTRDGRITLASARRRSRARSPPIG